MGVLFVFFSEIPPILTNVIAISPLIQAFFTVTQDTVDPPPLSLCQSSKQRDGELPLELCVFPQASFNF